MHLNIVLIHQKFLNTLVAQNYSSSSKKLMGPSAMRLFGHLKVLLV